MTNFIHKRWVVALIASVLALTAIIVVGNVNVARATSYVLGRVRSVSFLATANQSLLTSTSRDSGYVLGAGMDTTAWMPLLEEVHEPSGTGNFKTSYIPDSIFVSFKALDWAGTSADSALFSVSVQTRDPANPTIVSDTANVTTIIEALGTADTKVLGFVWNPRTKFRAKDTPMSYEYRYIFHGTGAGGTDHDGDTTRISTMREWRVAVEN